MSKKEENFVVAKNIKMDMEHTLDQLSSRYQSVKDGLPELIKNSKDHYFRLGVEDKKDRQILIIISENKDKLGVLDFAGAGKEDFEGWEEWSSRTANKKDISYNIEGGYGNGGKSFMVRGCLLKSSLLGYKNSKENRKGFINNNPSYKYRTVTFEDSKGNLIEDFKREDFKQLLNSELKEFRITINDLPQQCQDVLFKRKAFTFVKLEDVKDWKKINDFYKDRKIKTILPGDLMAHAQASLTIETCDVWIQLGKKMLHKGPLEVSPLDPLPGLEKIPFIPIPDFLEDPETGDKIKMNNKGDKNGLEIFATKQNLRLSDALKARNVVRVHNKNNIIANWSIADLVPSSASAFLYAKLTCIDLTEDYSESSTRMSLIDSSLTRALKHWTIKKLEGIVSKIQEIQSEKESEEDKKNALNALDEIRNLMNKFLEKEDTEENLNNGETGKRPPPPPIVWGKKLDELVLETPQTKILKMAKGTNIPLIVRGYENKDGNRLPLRSLPILFTNVYLSDVIDLSGKTSVVGLNCGKTKIFFETADKKIKSNEIEIEVLDITDIHIMHPTKILKQGEHVKINIIGITENQKTFEGLIYEVYIDEQEMGKIDREGNFIAGGIEGNATIRIRYGKEDDKFKKIILKIGKEKMERNKGSNLPYLLFCGDPAPLRENLPEDQRTVPPGEGYSTIIDYEPVWRNQSPSVIWINLKSKEAKKARSFGNDQRLASLKSKTTQGFILLKCFEILKRLKLQQKIGETAITNIEFLQKLALAETEASEFLDLAQAILYHLMQGREEDE